MSSRKRPPADPLALDPDTLAVCQAITFDADTGRIAGAMEPCGLFRVRRETAWTRAEWIRFHLEDDALAYALGTVTLVGTVCLLESFCEERISRLRRTVEEIAHASIEADETRVVTIEDAIRRPNLLFAPEGVPEGAGGAPSTIAREILRGAWAFLPQIQLQGRTAAAAARTERGRAATQAMLGSVVDRMRELAPSFPDLTLQELREALSPEPERVATAGRAPARARRPHS